MNKTLDSIFAGSIKQGHAMLSIDILSMIYRHALRAAAKGPGIIVEICSDSGASTIALALGVKDVGRGKVISIPFIDARNEKSYKTNHEHFLKNLTDYGVLSHVSHIYTDATSVSKGWTTPINLLLINGNQSYKSVSEHLQCWAPFVCNDGLILLDNYFSGSDVEVAVGENLQFSRYRLFEQINHAISFQKQDHPRKLFLCGGMQSSGSTLVSWCFLQRQDLDGVYDMENSLIQQDFSRVNTDSVWVKMTIGSFSLTEIFTIYQAQGWEVHPLLIQRDLKTVIPSLRGKKYGFDGITGDDPPLHIRVQRYISDLAKARLEGWPILVYDDLVQNPIMILKQVCSALELPWCDSMTIWPKPESTIAYMSTGNQSLRTTRNKSSDLIETIALFKKHFLLNRANGITPDLLCQSLLRFFANNPSATSSEHNVPLLPPSSFKGTRRHLMEKSHAKIENELILLKIEHSRIFGHIVFGPLLKFWRRYINHSFPMNNVNKPFFNNKTK